MKVKNNRNYQMNKPEGFMLLTDIAEEYGMTKEAARYKVKHLRSFTYPATGKSLLFLREDVEALFQVTPVED